MCHAKTKYWWATKKMRRIFLFSAELSCRTNAPTHLRFSSWTRLSPYLGLDLGSNLRPNGITWASFYELIIKCMKFLKATKRLLYGLQLSHVSFRVLNLSLNVGFNNLMGCPCTRFGLAQSKNTLACKKKKWFAIEPCEFWALYG